MPERKLRPYLRFAHSFMRGPGPLFLALMAIFAAVILVARLGLSHTEPLTLDKLFSVPSSDLSRKDLQYYVRVLSSYHMGGRESGRESGQKATEFLLDQYEDSDLPGYFKGKYVQEFPFPAGIQKGKNSRLSFVDNKSETMAGSENLEEYEEKTRAEVVPVAFATPSRAEGNMVFGGFCLSAPEKGFDELARINVYDRVVLCLRYGPGGRHGPYREAISFRAKYEALKRRGAKGVVFLGRPGTPPVYAEFFSGSDEPGPPAVFADPGKFYNRYHWLEEQDRKLLESGDAYSEFLGKDMGWVKLNLDYERETLTGRNVAASIKGSFQEGEEKNRKWIVVGAHYDHLGKGKFGSLEGAGEIHNGADDNASGTAAVLEMAFSLRKMYKEDPSILPEPYDVVFIHFDAEERGLFGAEFFVESGHFNAENTVAMLNLDMVGMLRKKKGLQLQGAQTADPGWKDMIARAYQSAGFAEEEELRFFPGGNGPSDHSPFYRKNIPVAFFFTGEHSHYHRSSDDFHELNFDGLYNIAFMARQLVLNLAASDKPPQFQEAPDVNRSDLEFDVRLGIIPGGYGETEGGLLVAGVKEGTPVEKTGIQKGDRIVFLGGKKIENIQDLTEFLYDARLNTSYVIRFKRDDRILEGRTELISGGAH